MMMSRRNIIIVAVSSVLAIILAVYLARKVEGFVGDPANAWDYIGKTYKIEFPDGCVYIDGLTNCYSGDILFQVKDAGNGKVRLHNTANGKCLYLENSGEFRMKAWECWNDPNMEFKILKTSGGLKLQHNKSGKCLKSGGNGMVHGITCDTSDVTLKLTDAAASSSSGNFVSQLLGKNYKIKFNNDKCLFPNNVWGCWNDPNMVFKLMSSNDNKVRVHHVISGKCLYIESGNLSMKSWACWNDPNMEFNVLDGGNGKIKLQHNNSGKCLGPSSFNNGSHVFGHDCNDNNKVVVELIPSSEPEPIVQQYGVISWEQFKNAVTSAGYPEPTNEQYNNLITLAKPKGNIDSKRELAMFLSQILWESGGLRYKKEIRCESNSCAGEYVHPPLDVPGKYYFGRGYMQLTWSYNYAAASQDLYGDKNVLLNAPEMVEQDSVAWSTAMWFWKVNVRTRPGVLDGQFGASTNAINGALECGGRSDKPAKRFEIYKKVMVAFGLYETPNSAGC